MGMPVGTFLALYYPQIFCAAAVLVFWVGFYKIANNKAQEWEARHQMRKSIRKQQKVWYLR